MKSLVAWLHRLASVTPEAGPSIEYFRVFVPGSDPLDIENWLFAVDPQGPVGITPQATGPESWSLLRLPDLPEKKANIDDRHRLGADLACLLSLALDRRVIVPVDFPIQLPQQQLHFHPVAQIVDQTIQGHLPIDAKHRVGTYFSAVAGLTTEDQENIGAACTAYHGALLLFDREPRAAYTLLITGIEVLSRKYGSPPTKWDDWESSSDWDDFLVTHGLSTEQAEAIRARLMTDKQLRLGLTFRTYASTRPRDSFWETPLDQWIYGIDAQTGAWLPPAKMSTRKVSDLMPADRTLLKKALATSYQLRSSVVHEAEWVNLMMLGQPIAQQDRQQWALSFPILRTLLAELIWVEISERTSPAALPDFQLLRQAPSAA